jgi:hypothetical protein
VQLPQGAKIVSLEPEPLERWTDGGIERLTYQATRGSHDPFNYKIQYRLAPATAAGDSAPSGSRQGM